MKSLIGQEIGKYMVTEIIGEGGMASVFKGYDQSIDRYVAIKVLVTDPLTESHRSRMLIDRFHLEAKTVAKLQHPHILSIHEYGIQDTILFLVMPYVAGGTLKDRIEGDQRLALGEVSKIIQHAAAALDYAHRQNVIHRDIKPSNILLDGEDNVMLADFGLAKIMTSDSTLTETGAIIGTPAYIAPEYASGEPMTHLSDIYALGITTFEAITGQTPFGDTSTLSPVQVVMQHISQPVPDISQVVENVPPILDAIFERVLAKDPTERYQTASEFAKDLRRAIRGHSDEIIVLPPRERKPEPDNFAIAREKSDSDSTSIVLQVNHKAAGATFVAALITVIAAIVLLARTTSSPENENPLEDTGLGEASLTANTSEHFGQASFMTTGGLGDTLSLQVRDLRTPPAGTRFYVWLTNTNSGESLLAGQLALDASGNGTVTYNHPFGLFLPAVFNALVITAEDDPNEHPSTDIYYSGSIPAGVSNALYAILLSSPEGINERGLLASVIAEAYLARQPYTINVDSTSMARILSNAESSLNAAFGTTNDYNGDGVGSNPGFGLGIPAVLGSINQQIDMIIAASPDQLRVQTHAEAIRSCLSNTTERLSRLSDLETALVSQPEMTPTSNQADGIIAILDEVMYGLDQNENGRIEGFLGECGLEQIAGLTLLIGSMDIDEQSTSPVRVAAAFSPYEFVSGQDFCLDDELTIGIAKNMNDHTDMENGNS